MKISTLVTFLLLISAAALIIWRLHPLWRGDQAVLQARTVAARVLAEELARRQPGAQALAIGNPYTQDAGRRADIYAFEKAGLLGVRQGLQGRIRLKTVAFPTLKPGAREDPRAVPIAPACRTPLSYLVAPDAFDALAREHADCHLFVSLIGLPAGIAQTPLWQTYGAPVFGLLLPDLRLLGTPAAIEEAFRSGRIVAAVIDKPGASTAPAAPDTDYHAVFDQLFLLLTADNVGETLRKYPALFKGLR